MGLRACYGKSGTKCAYGGTRPRGLRSSPTSPAGSLKVSLNSAGLGSRVEGRGLFEGRGSRVEGRGSRVVRGSRVEGRGSRVEGRGSSRVEGQGSRGWGLGPGVWSLESGVGSGWRV
eukprot:222653-Rhodomonas_salina.1